MSSLKEKKAKAERAAKGKSRKTKQKSEAKSVQEDEDVEPEVSDKDKEFLDDLDTRNIIRIRLLRTLSHMRSQQFGIDNSEVIQQIDHHLAYEIPFTPAELKELKNHPDLENASYMQPITDFGRVTFTETSINIVSSLKLYSRLLKKLSYTPLRSKILQQIDVFSQLRDRPVFLEDLLHRDELVAQPQIEQLRYEYELPTAILNEVENYNKMLLSGPHKPLPLSSQTIIISGPPRTIEAEIPKSLKELQEERSKILSRIEEKAFEPEEIEVEKEKKPQAKAKVTSEENVMLSATRQIKAYRDGTRQAIAEEKGIDPEDVEEEAIDEYILQSENLPAWTFLAQFSSQPVSDANTRNLLRQISGLDQFGRLFIRLHSIDQTNFAREVFSEFPIESWPLGPPVSLLSKITAYYNHVTSATPTDQELDDRLAKSLPSDFIILFKSLQSGQQLHYRELIFGRLPNLDKAVRRSILRVYEGYLENPAAKLVFKDESVLISYQNQVTGTLLSRALFKLDFILSWNESTKPEIGAWIKQLLSPQFLSVLVSKGSDVKYLQPIVTERVLSLMREYFAAIIPSSSDFTNFVQNIALQKIQEYLSAPVSQAQDIQDLPVEIPEATVQTLMSRFTSRRNNEKLAWNTEELHRQAARLGLNLADNIEQAAAEASGLLDDQLRDGEITPEVRDQKQMEITEFLQAYEALYRNVTSQSSELKHRQQQFQTFYQDRLDSLSSELEERLKRLDKQLWKEIIHETGLSSEVKQLRSFIRTRMQDLKQYAVDKDKSVSIEELEDEAWKDAGQEDIVSESKLRSIRTVYNRLKSEHEEKGAPLTTEAVTEQAWADAINSGILSADEVAKITAQRLGDRGMAKRMTKTITRRVKSELQKTVSNMPEALRKSLAQLIDDIAGRMNQVEQTKREEMSAYFKFLGSVMLASWNAKKEGKSVESRLEDIAQDFASKIPSGFIRKVLEMIRESQITGKVLTWNDLLNFTNQYTQQTVMLIYNPLVRKSERRRRRYNRLFDQSIATGEIKNLSQQLPAPLDPHLKECITAHQLKPWLNIPHIRKWKLLIADPSGKSRSEMNPSDRMYFNLPRSREFIIKLNGKKLFFYKPTNAYWINHCQLYHSASDPQICNAKTLKKVLAGKKPEFYELLIRFPLPKLKVTDSEISYKYEKDNDNIKFLSMDPTVYDRECKWFKERYSGVEQRLNSLRLAPLSSVPNARRYAVWELRQVLGLLRIKYGDNTISEQALSTSGLGEGGTLVRGDITRSANLLEDALYRSTTSLKGVHADVYSYFQALHSLLLFLDVNDPVTKHANFFQGLAAQCADAYFPTLLQNFATPQQRFPELFLLPGSSSADLLKEKVYQYLHQTIHILTERALLRELALNIPESLVEPELAKLDSRKSQLKHLQTGKSEDELDVKLANIIQKTEQATDDYNLSVGSLFTSDSLKLVAHVPNLTLKNVCMNSSDYEDIDDQWLVYYTHEDQVYCISKLQLAGMAQSKTYTFHGVEFDHKFVDSFLSYSDFTASELARRTEYIEAVTKALINLPENSQLFQELVTQKVLIGALNPEDVGQVLQQIMGIGKKGNKLLQRDDAYLISLVQQKIDNLIEAYISKNVLDLAESYIDVNRNLLIAELKSSYETYRKVDALSPSYPIDAERDVRMLVLAPVVGIVTRYVEETSPFLVDVKDRKSIAEMMDRKIGTSRAAGTAEVAETRLTIRQKEQCASCRAELEKMDRVPYRSVAQQRKGLETRTNYLAFCSQACFSKHKVSEISDEDAHLGRLQNAVNQLTKRTVDYTQMTLWARFPPNWKLPTDPKDRQNLLSRWANIRSLDAQEVQKLIQTLSLSENYLGISTRSPAGKELSQTELWDRIRTHPLFVPDVNTMLEPENYEALQTLAEAFGIVMYDGEDWENFYRAEPEELRNAWKQLRVNPSFIQLLYSTVKSFDPYQELSILDPRLEAVEDLNVLWKSVEDFCKQKLEDVADLHPQLFSDPDRIRDIRKNLVESASEKFSSLPLRPNLKKVYRMFTLQRTLRAWFTDHKINLLQRTPAVSFLPEDKSKGIIGSDKMIKELNRTCIRKLTAHELSIWTVNIIRSHRDKVGHSAPDKTRFATDFWPRLKAFCPGIAKLEESYTEYVFALEKLNRIVDEQMSEVMEERQHEKLPSPIAKPGKGRKLPAKAKLPRVEAEPSLAELLDRASHEELVASRSFVNMEPQVKTRLEILAKIQELRQEESKKARETRKTERKARELKPEKQPEQKTQIVKQVKASDEKEQEAELKKLLSLADHALSAHKGNVVKAIEQIEKQDLSQDLDEIAEDVESFAAEEFAEPEEFEQIEEVDMGGDDEEAEVEYGDEPEY